MPRSSAHRRSLRESLRESLGESLGVLRDGVVRNLVGRFRTLSPTVLQINVNARCNARCGMCNIWRTEDPVELPLARYEEIFADSLFRSIEYLCVSGGEPTLRRDLPEIVALALRAMPRLRLIAIPTTGIAADRSLRLFSRIARDCADRNVKLSIGVSLDGTGAVYDRVRGIPGGYAKVVETLVALKKLKQDVEFRLSLHPTITAMNIGDCDNLVNVGRELDLDVQFIMGVYLETYYQNSDLGESLALAPDEKEFLVRFLRDRARREPLLGKQAFYYEKVIEMMNGAPRALPCPYQNQGLVIEPTGALAYCINSRPVGSVLERSPSSLYFDPRNLAARERMTREVCPGCEVSCFVGVGLRSSPLRLLAFLARRVRERGLRAPRSEA